MSRARREPGNWTRPDHVSGHVREVSALIRESQDKSNKVSAWGALMYILPAIALVAIGMTAMGYFWQGLAQIIGLFGVVAAVWGVLYNLFCLWADFTERRHHHNPVGSTVLRLLFSLVMVGLGTWWFTFAVAIR